MKHITKNILQKLNLLAYADYLLFIKRRKRNKYNNSTQNIEVFYKTLISKNDIIFDIGANIGNYTDIFSKIGRKVISVEPQSYCYKFLALRFFLNRKIILLKKGIDLESGKKEIYISNSHTISSMSKDWINKVQESGRFSEFNWKRKEIIDVIPISELFKKYGIPYYCKIDVEGYEYNVIKGINQPIPLLSFEFNYETIDVAKKCLAHLTSLSEIEINLVFGSYIDFEFTKWQSYSDFTLFLDNINNNEIVGDIFVKSK